MPRTSVKSEQIKDGGVKRSDVNITTTGEALIRRLIAGTNISISSTGVDTGTGDVTVSVSSTPNFSSLSIGATSVIDSSRNLLNIGTISASGNLTITGSNILATVNSTSATTFSAILIQNAGVNKGGIGVSFATNAFIYGSAANDFCVRGSQKILFSADGGTTIHTSISATDFVFNTTNIKVGANTGQNFSAVFQDNIGDFYNLVFSKGILTGATLV